MFNIVAVLFSDPQISLLGYTIYQPQALGARNSYLGKADQSSFTLFYRTYTLVVNDQQNECGLLYWGHCRPGTEEALTSFKFSDILAKQWTPWSYSFCESCALLFEVTHRETYTHACAHVHTTSLHDIELSGVSVDFLSIKNG